MGLQKNSFLRDHNPEPRDGPVSKEVVEQELDRILRSRSFARSERLKKFLEFLVKKRYSENYDDLKEYTLGVEVYGRGPAFDPRIDSIVRVEAHRLRLRLSAYYQCEGRDNPIRIDIPVGTYAPVLIERRAQKVAEAQTIPAPRDPEFPTIVVLPFLSIAPDAATRYFSDGLTEELIDVLANFHSLRIVARTSAWEFKGKGLDIRRIGKLLNVEAVLEGSVRFWDARFRITAQLSQASTGYHIWSHTYEKDAKAGAFKLQAELARVIAKAVSESLLGKAS